MTSFFCTLNDIQAIAVTGEKAASFLQGQLTCDVRHVTSTQTRRAAYCTPKGRVLSTCRVVQHLSHLYLLLPTQITESIIARLKKYAIFSKVELSLDHTLKMIGCVGRQISETLAHVYGDLPIAPDSAIFFGNILVVRTQDAKDIPRFELIGTKEAMDVLQENLREKYAEEMLNAWHLSEIQAGIPTIYPRTAELFTPHMLNYPALQGVSFKKGCYAGQEVVARTQYLGKAKRHLQILQLHSSILPLPGDPIYDEMQQQVGIVVEAAFQKKEECLLCTVIQEAALQQGKKLYVHEAECRKESIS